MKRITSNTQLACDRLHYAHADLCNQRAATFFKELTRFHSLRGCSIVHAVKILEFRTIVVQKFVPAMRSRGANTIPGLTSRPHSCHVIL